MYMKIYVTQAYLSRVSDFSKNKSDTLFIYMCRFMHVRPMGCLKLQSFFAKAPLIIGLFCGKRPIKIRHPVGLRPLYLSPDCIHCMHYTCLQHVPFTHVS